MICPDINLLLYTINEAFPRHREAKAWWDGVLSGSLPVGMPHVVILGVIRLAMNRRVFPNPLTLDQAIEVVDGWLGQPNVHLIPPTGSHWPTLKTMLRGSDAGSSLTTDAHIAALASEYGMIIHSSDADFARFPGIRVVNPLRDTPA
jgi:uncharacterized protein